MLLDEVRLEEKCLGDAVGEHILEALRPLDQADVPHLETWPEVGAYPVAKNVRLPDI